MKKMFTLVAGLMIATFGFSRQGPSVIINSSHNFEVEIDGRIVTKHGRTTVLDDMRDGRHQVRVYENRRGDRGNTQRRLVSQGDFRLRDNDVMIRVDKDGNLSFKEKNKRGNAVRDREDDRDDDGDDDQDQRKKRKKIREREDEDNDKDDYGWKRGKQEREKQEGVKQKRGKRSGRH